ncbi:hypothetical protein EST38_g13391 [Candolleomyces aberdarensis]|uniref:DNA 3'-5' helicase n=1 Tax=Candolleomyces aberdarensis TaxID=2316362 RepID=A0A4Q2D140_9AGAR|nr:hypothetical protein EST38_g13391 [Candolleomyces aberdarensis]
MPRIQSIHSCSRSMASTVATLPEHIEHLRVSSPEEIAQLISNLGSQLEPQLPGELPQAYLDSLSDADRTVCYCAARILYATREGKFVPQEMQLRAIVADKNRKHINVTAGTGSGKTLPIALNILLDDPSKRLITITFSPLRQLQASQKEEFESHYGISTAVINDQTPKDSEWWNEHVWNTHDKKPGKCRHLIITVEQAFRSREGHLPPLYLLLCNPYFQRCVTRVNIDEVHCIYTAGTTLYGVPAFRPAWGRLPEIQAILPYSTIWAYYTATLPPHIHSMLTRTLLTTDNFVNIFVTSNRPNIIYATHRLVKNMDEARNYRCFVQSPFQLSTQPHVLIFVDNLNLCNRICNYLCQTITKSHQNQDVIMHYHSQMSDDYLKKAHDEFTSSTGKCRVLVAASGQSVGVDFPNVEIVCTVGLPPTGVDAIQRGGRGGRKPGSEALFVIFYEDWVESINLPDYLAPGSDLVDPDRPRSSLKSSANRRERAPYSMVKIVQEDTCIRHQLNIDYLNDRS